MNFFCSFFSKEYRKRKQEYLYLLNEVNEKNDELSINANGKTYRESRLLKEAKEKKEKQKEKKNDDNNNAEKPKLNRKQRRALQFGHETVETKTIHNEIVSKQNKTDAELEDKFKFVPGCLIKVENIDVEIKNGDLRVSLFVFFFFLGIH